jgi:hypothetical protein
VGFGAINNQQTAAQIRDSLASLSGANRLDASAIKNLSSGGLTSWQLKTTDYTAVAGDRLRIDATAGDIVITLPASPSASDADIWLQRIDASANDVLIRSNPIKINSQTGKDGVFAPSPIQLIEVLSYVNSTIGWLGQFDRLTYQDAPSGGGGGGTDPNYANVALLLRASGSGYVDMKGNTVNTVSTVTVSTTVTKFGHSIFLNGGYLSIPQISAFDLGSQDFTLEFWYQSVATNTFSGIFSLDGTDFPLGIYHSTATGSNFRVFAGTTTAWVLENLDAGLPSTAQFDHYAISRNGSDWRTYKNGALVSSATYSGTIGTPTDPMRIGNNNGSSLIGHLEELRLTVGVGRYPSAFTPPTAQFPTS